MDKVKTARTYLLSCLESNPVNGQNTLGIYNVRYVFSAFEHCFRNIYFKNTILHDKPVHVV